MILRKYLIEIKIQIIKHSSCNNRKKLRKLIKSTKMEAQQFRYILEDLKSEQQQIPSLENLLKLTQKTTKKLQCMNLYAHTEKRNFDLQIEESSIYSEIGQLYNDILQLKQQTSEQLQTNLYERIQEIKQKYTSTFDILSKQQEILTKELETIDKKLTNTQKQQMLQIKELQQYEDQPFQANLENQQGIQTFLDPKKRIQKLKKQIEEIQKQITKLNYGKGKWFDKDHQDFIKIFNRCNGNDKKIISEGIKMLGMNQAQIMDHLELYDNYLQLQKEKKLNSEEYKQIKFLEQEDKKEKQQQIKQQQRNNQKINQDKAKIDRLKKKQEIKKFKQKKEMDKLQMIRKEQEQNIKKLPQPIKPAKKKQIAERNKVLLQSQQRKIQQIHKRRKSMDASKRGLSSKAIAKK